MEEYKLLWLSDSPLLPTGFSNQSREITKRLAQEPEFKIDYLGAQYAGRPMYVDFDNNYLTASSYARGLPRLLGNGKHAYGEGILNTYLKTYNYDLLTILLDMFMVYYLNNIEIKPTKFIMYFPSDGEPLPLFSENILRKATVSVAMSKFAQEQAIDVGIDAKYIPHATDVYKFYPMLKQEKQILRQKWSQKLNYPLQDKFICGVVSRNQGRKMLDRLFVAFAEFAKNVPNAVLLAHTDPFDSAAIVNLYEFAKRYKIQDRVVYSGATLDIPYEERDLLELYNLMDVFAIGTSGEGFNIAYVEAMACEVPVISTQYTTTNEIVVQNNAGIGVSVESMLTGTWNVDRAIVDVKEMARAMQYFYDNPKEIERMGKNGRQAVLKEYSWHTVYNKWRELIFEVLEK